VARYPRGEWYLHQLSCAVLRGPCSEAADAQLAAMEGETDLAKSAQLTNEALGAAGLANFYIPLGTPIRWSLVRDRVGGFLPNSVAFHPLPPLAQTGE
jgi:ABC-type transport system substrate-binding protein